MGWSRLFLLVLLLGLAGCADEGPPPTWPGDPTTIEHEIPSSDYLLHRFFRVDLPPDLADAGYERVDAPGRREGWFIARESIQVYRLVASGGPDRAQNIAAIVDTTGRWGAGGGLDLDAIPFAAWASGADWVGVAAEAVVDRDGRFRAIDLGREMAADDVLAVTYDVVDQTGAMVYRVGDRPAVDPRGLADPEGDLDYYRLKLLKPAQPDAFSFLYELRNVYDLGAANIDHTRFDLRIERRDGSPQPDVDENGIPYVRVFGLDRHSVGGQPVPDGQVDIDDPYVFDLARGLLRFPADLPFPFAATGEQYAANAMPDAPGSFLWSGTWLQRNLAPELYDWRTPETSYPEHAAFTIVVVLPRPDANTGETP